MISGLRFWVGGLAAGIWHLASGVRGLGLGGVAGPAGNGKKLRSAIFMERW